MTERFQTAADRTATFGLVLLGFANWLLLAAFLLVAMTVGRAQAQTAACAGKDMVAELAASDPAKLGQIESQAAGVLHGRGLLWKLEKSGAPASFLFGTMHMTDPRVTTLTPAAQAAFDAASTVVIETTDVLDQAKMMAALGSRPELMMFTDATTLPSLLSPPDLAAMNAALEERGIPAASIVKMKPWMLSAMVALPACELARKAAGAPVLDIKLAEDAKKDGKRLEGLETMIDQLEAMASLPMDLHLKGLVETLKLGDRASDMVETMIDLYEKEQVGMIMPFFRVALPGMGDDQAGYAAFEEAMITTRNRTMAAHAEPILAQGNAFIAVGALHLPGPGGLVELFRKGGYTVTPAG